MGEGEEQLQKEWREIVMGELESLKKISSETRDIILRAGLEKIGDHESRLRGLEQSQRRLDEVSQLRKESASLRQEVDHLKGWKNKAIGIWIGAQLVILVVWVVLVNFGNKFMKW